METTTDFQMTASEKEEILDILGDARPIFENGLYVDMIVAYHHNLLEPFAYHVRKVYIETKTLSNQLIESIFAVAMFNCDNKYCYLYHTGELLRLGFSEQEILNLTDHFILPKGFPEKGKWEEVLKLTHFMFRRRDAFAFDASRAIREKLTPAEYDHYLQVLSLGNVIFQLLVAFDQEINIDHEPQYKMVDSNEFNENIKRFLKYCETRDNQETRENILTICSYCKNIKSSDGNWLRIERVLQTEMLDSRTEFSHGICESCYEKAVQDLNK